MTIEAFNRVLEVTKLDLNEPYFIPDEETMAAWDTTNGGHVILFDEYGSPNPLEPFVNLVATIGSGADQKIQSWRVDGEAGSVLPPDAVTAALAWLSDQTPGIAAAIIPPEPPASPVAKTRRKAIPKAVRFEVFKRDKFTCQYCGAKAPDVMLECDHITPHSLTQDNIILNLVTACHSCNNGKSDKVLSDDSALAKQHAQLSQLQERRDQLEMMMQWQRALAEIDASAVESMATFYADLVPGRILNEKGKSEIKAALRSYSFDDIATMLRDATAKHLRIDGDSATDESADIATRVFFNEMKYRKRREQDPVGSQLAYVSGIVRKRSYSWSTSRSIYCRERLREAFDEGVTLEEIKRIAIESGSWSDWNDHMDSYLGGFRESVRKMEEGER